MRYLFRRLALVSFVLMGLGISTPSYSSVIFEFVCVSSSDCDGDSLFNMTIELDDSVVIPNTSYVANLSNPDGGAGFIGWSVTSGISAFSVNAPQPSFTISGGLADVAFLTGGNMVFVFDSNGLLSEITETGFATGVMNFRDAPLGELSFKNGNTINNRRYIYPGGNFSGRYDDGDDIVGRFALVGGVSNKDESLDVPEPAALALMGLGLIGIGFSRRLRNKKVA